MEVKHQISFLSFAFSSFLSLDHSFCLLAFCLYFSFFLHHSLSLIPPLQIPFSFPAFFLSFFLCYLGEDKPLIVGGSGRPLRQFVYSEDAAEVLLKVVHTPHMSEDQSHLILADDNAGINK